MAGSLVNEPFRVEIAGALMNPGLYGLGWQNRPFRPKTVHGVAL
jgi:hypothetical protein